jgi:hypothetical protein
MWHPDSQPGRYAERASLPRPDIDVRALLSHLPKESGSDWPIERQFDSAGSRQFS